MSATRTTRKAVTRIRAEWQWNFGRELPGIELIADLQETR
jgi:hypothetical protein